MIAVPMKVAAIQVAVPMSAGATLVSPAKEYAGPYEIVPDFAEQVLVTGDMLMTDNVTIHRIPVARTDNAAGGITVTIG